MKYWKLIIYVLGFIPFGFITSILTFYFHAGHILGRLPSYDHPDPKELEIYSDYAPFVNWTGLIWFYSFGIWLVVIILYVIVNRKNIVLKPVLISSIGEIIAVFILFSGILEWYLD